MKVNRPYSKQIESNILAVLNQATADEREQGLYWYLTAHNDAQAIADRHSIGLMQAAGVIASLSPGLEWGRNLIDAERLISAWRTGQPIPAVGAYGQRNITKAIGFLEGQGYWQLFDRKSGPKTYAFYWNMLSPTIDVTIDRHAKCLAMDIREDRSANAVVKPNEYDWLSRHYRIAAEITGLMTHQVQAITWTVWRRLMNETKGQ